MDDRTLDLLSRQLGELNNRVNRLEQQNDVELRGPVIDRLRGVPEPYHDLCREAIELIEALEAGIRLRDAQLNRYKVQLVELSNTMRGH